MSFTKRAGLKLMGVVFVAVLSAALAGRVAPAWPADGEVVIGATAVEPRELRAIVAQRVNFVVRVGSPVHVEFGDEPKQHHIFQVPVIGHIWGVFYRPGTHPYIVHVYGRETVVLRGVVEVAEDPARPFGPGTCGAMIMGECIEP